MSEKKPICGILAGEPEIIGERCADGGKCHHRCTDTCLRRSTCAPLSGSGLRFDWSVPALRADADLAGDRFEVPVSGWSGPAHDEREAVERFSPTTSVPHSGRASEVEAYMTEDDGGEYMTVTQHERIVARLSRPAQTEQQPIAWATEREGDPTFPRLHKDEHQADHWVQVCNVAPPIIKRPLYAAPIAQTAPQPVSSALADVVAERRRQIAVEGWTPEHDDEHSNGEMALAAACYARHAIVPPALSDVPATWPWGASWWKPGDPRRMLVKAAALILAEIERLDRAAARGGAGDE